MFIHNPHDSKSMQLRNVLLRAGLINETHILDFDKVKEAIPIQAVPCVFILGSDDMLVDFDEHVVVNNLQWLKDKLETEQLIQDMTSLLTEGGLI